MALLKCPCAFRLRAVAQSMLPGLGISFPPQPRPPQRHVVLLLLLNIHIISYHHLPLIIIIIIIIILIIILLIIIFIITITIIVPYPFAPPRCLGSLAGILRYISIYIYYMYEHECVLKLLFG